MNTDFTRRNFIRNAGITFALIGFNSYLSGGNNGFHSREPSSAKDTWIDLNGRLYGAKPDETGPLGGGGEYNDIFIKGDYEPTSLDELIDALSIAKPGEVVYIPDENEIDLTTYIYIDQFILEIPAGVILAGNRGYKNSKGALLNSDALKTPLMIRTLGPGVRITGLRIKGPNPKRHMAHHHKSFKPGGPRHEYYYKFPVSKGIVTRHPELHVDNCEISAFSHSGIQLLNGVNHHIHHNFIHQCQYNGLGYGISQDLATATIEYNLFDENRHSIAGTGKPGCSYIARHNVELGISLNHCFDMHGGKDRKDGTSIAGTNIEIYNNTFRAPQPAIGIRGEPENQCKIYRNWFAGHSTKEVAIRSFSLIYDRINVYDNVYGAEPTHSE